MSSPPRKKQKLVFSSFMFGNNPLFEACQEGNEVEVASLLEAGRCDLYSGCPLTGAFPLYIACQEGYIDIVRQLLDYQASLETNLINKSCLDGTTSLHIAAEHGATTIMELLLENRAIVDQKTDTGCSSLFLSCQNYQREAVEAVALLLRWEASPLLPRDDGTTPFFVCCFKNQVGMLKEMIQCQPELIEQFQTCSCLTATPLHIAAQEGHQELLDYINELNLPLLCVDSAMLDEEQTTPLHIACSGGNLSIIKKLLDMKANPNSKEQESGLTPLMLAAKENHSSALSLLLSTYSGVSNTGNIPLLFDIDSNGDTVVSLSSRYGSLESLQELCKYKGAKRMLNGKNHLGRSPLFLACAHQHVPVIEFLLSNNANPNAVDGNGVSPLFIATQTGNMLVVDTLLKVGVDCNVSRKSDGIGPLHLVSLLHDSKELVDRLIACKANVDLKSNYGETPLHVACQENNIPVTRFLLEHQANIYQTTNDGFSPSDIAETEGHTELAAIVTNSSLPPC